MSDTQLFPQERQLAPMPEPSIGGMLQGIIAGGITEQNVGALEKLMDLYERNENRQAEKDFASALTDLQGETSRVSATKKVDEKSDGSCRYKFAPYEEIMAKVQPMLTKHGFSVTFDTEMGEQRLISVCTLTHRSGAKRQNRFAVKYSKPPGSSEAQGDMSTKSYAKRGALCDALNIVIDHDDDARAQGESVTREQAADLRELCEATDTNVKAFLDYARAATFEEIPADRFDELLKQLKKKESKK